MDTLKKIGRAIREKREELGISQEKLAELSGLHRTYRRSVDRGERNLSIMNLEKIARALRTTVAILVKRL